MKPSRLYSFLDNNENYAITFFNGKRAVHDLTATKHLTTSTYMFFRDALLCTQHIIQFFKNNENVGFYIDAEEPHFFFKLESNTQGFFRTMLSPEDIHDIPLKISGIVRLRVFGSLQKEPYQSIIQVINQDIESMVNSLLERSYQIEAKIFLSPLSDQSIMISKLPNPDKEKSQLNAEEYLAKRRPEFDRILEKSLDDQEAIVEAFKQADFTFVQGKDIVLFCPCSKQIFISHIFTLGEADQRELFKDGQESISIKCHYCGKDYVIQRDEIAPISPDPS